MSDTNARHLRVHPVLTDHVDGGTPRFPEMYSHFTIAGLPQYKFNDDTLIEAVRRLIANGVNPIIINREVGDHNYPDNPPPAQDGAQQQVIDFNGESPIPPEAFIQ